MARVRGRTRRGVRCRSPIPHGHWKTTTFTGALRLSGMTAPMVLDGPMTANGSSPMSSRSSTAHWDKVVDPGEILNDRSYSGRTLAGLKSIYAIVFSVYVRSGRSTGTTCSRKDRTTSGHMFRDLIPELADRYRVIAPDLPGSATQSRRQAASSIIASSGLPKRRSARLMRRSRWAKRRTAPPAARLAFFSRLLAFEHI